MAEPNPADGAVADNGAPPPGWRFRVGLGLIIAGILSPLGALVVPFTGFSLAIKATLSGMFLAGIPEVFTLAAVAIMGKPGFLYVKGRIMALLRRYGPPKEVGRVRYIVGLVMFVIPAIYAWIIMYAPPAMVPGFPDYQIPMSLAMDAMFIISFFVLGGDFWDKVRALFVRRAKATFPI